MYDHLGHNATFSLLFYSEIALHSKVPRANFQFYRHLVELLHNHIHKTEDVSKTAKSPV